MKLVEGFWLPDNEEHLVPFLEKGPKVHGGATYQYHKLEPALALLPPERRRHAIDVGAHCGLWSRVLWHEFKRLTAFEPVEAHRECFVKNVPQPYDLYPVALGQRRGLITLHTGPSSSGDTYVQDDGEHLTDICPLDSYDLDPVDFIKIDCEGFEYFIVQGAERTIRWNKPVIIVEQKRGKGRKYDISDTAAVDLLQQWGATVKFTISGDYALAFE